MSTFRFDAETSDAIELAIDNGWTLRPTGVSHFVNIDYQKNIPLSDKSHILESLEDLDKYPSDVTSVSFIAMHTDINFVCLDLDFKNEELKNKLFNFLDKKYKLENLFLRIGNKEKPGQLWFQSDVKMKHSSLEGALDLIVNEKRCNALGYYKDTQDLYQWPYKKFWEHTPEDLPFISKELVLEIFNLISTELGIKKNNLEDLPKSRHAQLEQRIEIALNKPGFLNIIQDVITSPEYLSIDIERDAHNEAKRLISHKAMKLFDGYYDISGFLEDENKDLFSEFNVDTHPKVEKNSFIDIFYKAIKRNQFTDSKSLAFFSSLSVAAWLLTFTTRFEGMAPNLMILILARSGAGKSTSSRAIKELIKLYREFQPSFMGGDIKTEAALLNNLEVAPNPMYIIDEFTKVYRSKNNKNTQTGNISEILYQLYSDYSDTDLHQVKLKSHSYGVCLGPKINLLAFSTPEFYKMLSESDLMAGMARRTLIYNDNKISFAKKNVEYNKDFFKPQELQIIKLFMDTHVRSMFPYVTENVKGYQIPKGQDKKGETTYWEEALRINVVNELKATAEVNEYLKTTFVDKCNLIRKKSLSTGNNLDLFVTGAMAEMVKKFAMIHAIAGKAIFEINDEGKTVIAQRTHIEMDSIEWAEKMFYFYVVNGLSVDLESIFNKDKESFKLIEDADNLIIALKGSNKKTFTRSDTTFKNYFRNLKSANRSEIIENLLHRNIIKSIGSTNNKRGQKFEIIDSEES